jgi:hypothetical protein
MARQITIAGKELTLAYNLHAAVSYEKMTGKSALDLSMFQNTSIAPIVELGYCMLISNNPSESVPSFEAMMKEFDNINTMTAFIQAVGAELTAFFKPDATTISNTASDEKNA